MVRCVTIRQLGLVFWGAISFASVIATSLADFDGGSRTVAVFAPVEAQQPLSGLFYESGFFVQEFRAEELAEIDSAAPDLLVIGPGARVPPESRPAIDRFRRAGGAVAVLDPAAFSYPNALRDAVPVIDLSEPAKLSIRKGSLSGHEPQVEVRTVRSGNAREAAVEVITRRIGEGDVSIEIPLQDVRSPARSILAFEAKGGPGVSILHLAIRDTAGRKWVAFAEVTPEWTAHELAFEDFLPQQPKGSKAEFLAPAEVKTLEIGMVSRILWPEQGGSFSIAHLSLGEASRPEPIRTAAVAPWGVQYEALRVPFPDWIWDPFWQTRPVEPGSLVETATGLAAAAFTPNGPLSEVPKPPHMRGRTHAPASTKLAVDDLHYRVLATAKGAEGGRVAIAEWRRHNEGPYAGSSLVLIGAPEEDFSPGSPWGALLDAGVARSFEPGIVRVAPVLPKWEGDETPLTVRVEIANPSAQPIAGRVAVDIGSGAVNGEAPVSVGAGETAFVDVALSEVPADFNWLNFQQRIDLRVADRVVDSLTDEVDLGGMLLHTARYLVSVQKHHGDGRYSHHYFSDQYSARFLAAFARLLRTDRADALSLRVTDAEIDGFEESAFRFGDMIVRRQEPDGSFPMGYFEHRDFKYVADLGQVSMGLVQLASWLPEADPRRESYLDTVTRYLEFRQSFRMTPERVEKLEREHGPQRSIREGYYGLGLLDIDYFGDAKWGELRREERGPWWVLPVSLGFLGGLAELEGNPEVREIARMDVGTYFGSDAKITQVAHFHAESLFWILYAIEDPDLRAEITRKLNSELPERIFRGVEYPYFEYQGRAAIWPLSAVYAHRYIEEKPAWRSAFLAGLLATGADSSSNSLRNLVDTYPVTTYGPSLAAYRYASFSAIWLLELVDEGSSLLHGAPLPREAR